MKPIAEQDKVIGELVSSKALKDARLTILNAAGRDARRMEHVQGHSVYINGNGLPAGLYLSYVTDGVNNFIEKLVMRAE